MGWGNHHDDHPSQSEAERRLEAYDKARDAEAARAWERRERVESSSRMRYGGTRVATMIRIIEDHLDDLMQWKSIPDILDDWDRFHSLTLMQINTIEHAWGHLVVEQNARYYNAENYRKQQIERKKQLIRSGGGESKIQEKQDGLPSGGCMEGCQDCHAGR